jgi:hypothetical protein
VKLPLQPVMKAGPLAAVVTLSPELVEEVSLPEEPVTSFKGLHKELLEAAFVVFYEQQAKMERLHDSRSPLANRVPSSARLLSTLQSSPTKNFKFGVFDKDRADPADPADRAEPADRARKVDRRNTSRSAERDDSWDCADLDRTDPADRGAHADPADRGDRADCTNRATKQPERRKADDRGAHADRGDPADRASRDRGSRDRDRADRGK